MTDDQRKLFWVLVGKIIKAKITFAGRELDKQRWKNLIVDQAMYDRALTGKYAKNMFPSLDGQRIISLGHSLTELSDEEASDAISTAEVFCSEYGVKIGEP